MNLFRRIHPVKDVIFNLAQKEFRLFISVFLTVAAGWLFIVIADNVNDGSTQKFDESVILLFREPASINNPLGGYGVESSVRDITSLGSGTVLFIITMLVSGFLILRKDNHSLLLVLFAVIGGALLSIWFKELFGRERPLEIYRLVAADSLSFPSGHSMMSAVVYLSLAVLVSRVMIKRIMRIYIIAMALFLTFIIGLSRIYLGVHYPTDVIGGWALGMAWAGICWFTAFYSERKFRNEKKD